VPGAREAEGAVLPNQANKHHATIARAFRWRKLLETGAYGTIEELAAAEKINASYVSRVLRLTLLAPDIIEAILDGRHAPGLTLANTMKHFPVL
jgi:AraC-like DNA-binding protein